MYLLIEKPNRYQDRRIIEYLCIEFGQKNEKFNTWNQMQKIDTVDPS